MFDTEAEFRGYDVMLHLHDSNILRQVLSYRKEVRESKPVRLALQLSNALQDKNYVRFFRLLKKEATFLQCCLCHRYFNTVQSKALLTMMTAYGRNPVFNLDTILRILAWNDRNDALTTLIQYGVHQNDMDCDQVILNRDLFVQDISVPLRPYRWIDDKNTDTLSQVAYGPIPFSFSSMSSQINSFDDSFNYTKDPVIAAVFERYSLQSEEQQQQLTRDYPFGKQFLASYAEAHEMQSRINYIVENVLHDIIDEQSFLICQIESVKEVANSLSHCVLEDIIRKFIHDYIDSTAHFIAEKFWCFKLVHIVDKETKAILRRTLKMDLNEMAMGLRRFRERMQLLWLRQFWDAWRSYVLENRRRRLERHRNWERFQGVWNCQSNLSTSWQRVLFP